MVVVVTAADTDAGEAQARALASVPDTSALVLCGHDAARLGALAAALRGTARVSIFVDDPGAHAAALVEMVRELYEQST